MTGQGDAGAGEERQKTKVGARAEGRSGSKGRNAKRWKNEDANGRFKGVGDVGT